MTTLADITDKLDLIGERMTLAQRRTPSVLADLHEQAAEAVWERSAGDTERVSGGGHVTHTPPGMRAAAGLAYQHRQISKALSGVLKALDELERVQASAVSSGTAPAGIDPDSICNGWWPEGQEPDRMIDRACGKLASHFIRNDGTMGFREHCDGCRQRKSRHERSVA